MLNARHSVLVEAGGGFGKSALIGQVRARAGGGVEVRLPRDHPVTVDELTSAIVDAAGQPPGGPRPPAARPVAPKRGPATGPRRQGGLHT
ncbi:hypothetical protein ACFXKW_00540, partial [Streptomyces sp. NPDC059193]